MKIVFLLSDALQLLLLDVTQGPVRQSPPSLALRQQLVGGHLAFFHFLTSDPFQKINPFGVKVRVSLSFWLGKEQKTYKSI